MVGAAPGRLLSVRVVAPPTWLLMSLPHRRHPLFLTVVCIARPEVRDSDLMSPHKTDRDECANALQVKSTHSQSFRSQARAPLGSDTTLLPCKVYER